MRHRGTEHPPRSRHPLLAAQGEGQAQEQDDPGRDHQSDPREIVTNVDHVGNVKRTSVFGVVAKGGTVRLADGTQARRRDRDDRRRCAQAGAPVAVTLRFDNGRSHVKTVKPKPRKPVKPPKKPRSVGNTGGNTGTATAPGTGTTAPRAGHRALVEAELRRAADPALGAGRPAQRQRSGADGPAQPERRDAPGARRLRHRRRVQRRRPRSTPCTRWARRSSATSTPASTRQYRSDASKFQASRRRSGAPPTRAGPARTGSTSTASTTSRRSCKRASRCARTRASTRIEPDEITAGATAPASRSPYADQIAYNRALAELGARHRLSIGLKSDLEQAHDLVGDFDWTLNEECYQYSECTTISNEGPGADGKDWPGLQLFSQAGKAVWIAEYKTTPAVRLSARTRSANHFNTAVYKLACRTNGGRQPCAGTW